MASGVDLAGAPSLVVFVHGTGAGDMADRGVKWWQIGGPFAESFAMAAGPNTTIDRPFHWSGLNSEGERRAAGQALLARLYQFEAAGAAYHLVGHSHGGSVIWHALAGSARNNRRLHGLKSWSTVGTPFLKFVAQRANLWRWIAAIMPLGLAVWLFTLAPATEWIPAFRALWNSNDHLGAAVFLGLFTLLVILVLWALSRIALPLLSSIGDLRERRHENIAADWYGDQWLALWHPLDEPINSLAGTLGDAPPITPRVARDGVFGIIPLAGAVVNGLLARAADQFAWKLITDRAQGADRRGYVLSSVGRAPEALAPGFEPLAPELASEMATASDAKSIDSVRRLRQLLENAYDLEGTESVFDRVATVISFQEIIHTSYFEHPPIAKLLAAQVQYGGARLSDNAIDLRPRRIATLLVRPRGRFPHRRSLEIVTAGLLFILPAIVLAFGARGAFQGTIAPLTTDFQVDQIAATLTEPRYLSAGNSAVIGDIVLRLVAMNRITDPVTVVDRIPQAEPRRRAAIRLALAFGRTGQISEVERLLRRSEPAEVYPFYADAIRVFAFVGHVDSRGAGRDAAFVALAGDFINAFTQKADPRDYLRMELARLLLARLDSANLSTYRAMILDFARRNVDPPRRYSEADLCEFVRPVARARARENPRESLAAIVDVCSLEDHRNGIVQNARLDLIALGDPSKLQDFHAANGLTFLDAQQIENRVKKNFEADEKPGGFQRDPFASAVPDLVQLETRLTKAIEDDLRDYNSWPRRLGWRRLSNFLQLARTTQRLGATRIAKILAEAAWVRVSILRPPVLDFSNLEVTQRTIQNKMEEFADLIETLVALDLSDLAKKKSDEMVEQVQLIPEGYASIRLISYGEIARAAASLKDTALAKWVAERALAIPIKDLNFVAITSMLTMAEGLYVLDVELARKALRQAELMVDIVASETGRSASHSEIAKLWAKFGDVRLARLAAARDRATASEMNAYVDILDAILAATDNSAAQKFAVGKFNIPLPDDIQSVLNRARMF